MRNCSNDTDTVQCLCLVDDIVMLSVNIYWICWILIVILLCSIILFILIVSVMLSIIKMIVIRPSVIILRGIMLTVIMLSAFSLGLLCWVSLYWVVWFPFLMSEQNTLWNSALKKCKKMLEFSFTQRHVAVKILIFI